MSGDKPRGFFAQAAATFANRFSQKKDEPEVQYAPANEKKVKDLEARDQTAEKASQVVTTLLGVYKKRVRRGTAAATRWSLGPSCVSLLASPVPHACAGWSARVPFVYAFPSFIRSALAQSSVWRKYLNKQFALRRFPCPALAPTVLPKEALP